MSYINVLRFIFIEKENILVITNIPTSEKYKESVKKRAL